MTKKIVIASVSVLISLLVFEFYLKINRIKWGLSENGFAGAGIFVPDTQLIYAPKPGAVAEMETSEFHEYTVLNSMGFKGPEISEKRDGETRILTVGDSFTYGYGLSYEDSYPHKLQEYLNRDPEASRSGVINAGVWGYGLDQEYKFIRSRALSLNPDIVIWNITVPNDFYDFSPGYSWTIPSLFDLNAGGDSLIPLDARANWLYLSEVLYLRFPVLHDFEAFNLLVKSASSGNLFNRRPLLSYSGTLDWGLQKTVVQIKDVHEFSLKKNFKLYVVLFPQMEFFEKNDDPVFITVQNLKNRLRENKIGLIDLEDEILKHSSFSASVESLYYRVDGHPNRTGAEEFARITAEILKGIPNE